MALSQQLKRKYQPLITVLITVSMFAQIYLVIFAMDVII
jgi:hypothetical protein